MSSGTTLPSDVTVYCGVPEETMILIKIIVLKSGVQ